MFIWKLDRYGNISFLIIQSYVASIVVGALIVIVYYLCTDNIIMFYVRWFGRILYMYYSIIFIEFY